MIACCQSASAALVTINFDSLTAAPFSAAGNSIPVAARLSNQFASSGVLFESLSPYVPVVNLGIGTTSPPNAIGGSSADGLISYSVPITLTFVSPLDPNVPGVTNFVSIKGDTVVTGLGSNTMIALDILGNPIAFDVKVEPPAVTLTVTGVGIHKVIIIGSGSTAFDDLSFNTVTAVPEPATLLLTVTGAAVLLLGARRKARRESSVARG